MTLFIGYLQRLPPQDRPRARACYRRGMYYPLPIKGPPNQTNLSIHKWKAIADGLKKQADAYSEDVVKPAKW